MSPTTLTPPESAIDALADDVAMVACHEMGHALGALVAGLPLQCVRVYYAHDPGLDPEWSVEGRTELVADRDDGLTRGDGEQELVMVLAGLEAEARWMADHHGGTVDYRRAQVWRRPLHQAGDIARLDACLPDANRGLGHFVPRVAELIDRYWRDLLGAADELQQYRELHDDSVTQLLPVLPRWQLG